ncbi:MAG: energy transducer TonB, partial [Acidobacteriota bacterium]|nr:energy transducer TonB [Acidobacteriota bacterium]
MSSIEPGEKFISEDELKGLLKRWLAPEPSKSLDQRVANSYHREIESLGAAQAMPLAQSQKEVVMMKLCSTCKEEFADKFSFCPVDGTPLTSVVSEPEQSAMKPASFGEPPLMASSPALAAAGSAALVPRGEFHLTFIDDAGLATRLSAALKGVAHESELTWPEFKRDPFGFSKRMVVGYGQAGWRFMSQPNVATGVLTSLFIMMSAVLLIIWLDRVQTRRAADQAAEQELVVESFLDIPTEQPTPDEGTAGLAKGSGGGSKPKQEKAGGGGGGGRQEQTQASAGKPPQADLHIPPIVAPDPHPPTVKNPVLPVAAQLDADKVLFPPDARVLPYGLKTGPTTPSSGPGTGNGMGTGTGGGMGPGEGSGYGPGRGGNTGGGDRNEGGGGPGGGGGGTDYNKVFSGKDVSSKARVLSKPEPQYTEEARKNQITGTVVLRAVFTSGGQVTNIRAVSGLPYGLTERAIAAARQIK